MKRLLAKHFPTLARLELQDWIMLFLAAMLCWSILYGIMLPIMVDKETCIEAGVCY